MTGSARAGRLALAALVVLLTVAASVPAGAQPPAKARVGWVGPAPSPLMPIFLHALRERGWVEGENLLIEERYPEGGDLARIPGLVADLVKLRVDVIVTSGATSTGAAQKATRTIPVVFGHDPELRGRSARPAGLAKILQDFFGGAIVGQAADEEARVLQRFCPGKGILAICLWPARSLPTAWTGPVSSHGDIVTRYRLHARVSIRRRSPRNDRGTRCLA